MRSRDLVRKNERRGKYVSHEPVDYLLGLLGHEDAYPSHAFTLEVDGYASLLYSDLIVAGSHLLAYTRTFSAMPNWKVFEKKVKNFQFSSSTIFDNAT